jgi:hypothetical protein
MHKKDKFGKSLLLLVLVAIIFMILSALAIHDIYKGAEPDLDTEWLIVRTSFVMNCILGILVIIYFIRKKIKGE